MVGEERVRGKERGIGSTVERQELEGQEGEQVGKHSNY